jgi:carbon monoxide dehydrogenase subunit G
MQLTGEYILPAKPADVWRALNDPDVLRQCIPGCQSLEKLSDTAFKATVGTRIGPLQATFNGEVTLSDLDPPNGYTISGSGSGGVVGGAKGGAKVRLAPEGDGTKLTYDVDAQVTGKIAQLGSRLVDSTAKMMAGQFFDKFRDIVSQPADAVIAGSSATPKPATGLGEVPGWVWLAAAAVLALAGFIVLTR